MALLHEISIGGIRQLKLLPALARSEAGDVGGVVARVPVVEGESFGEIHAAGFGVVEAALEIFFGHGLEQADPARVQRVDERERDIDGKPAAVGERGPGGLVVWLDGGPIFGEGELEANVAVGVAVGDVVHELADGPATVAVGRVDLRVVEAGDGFAEVWICAARTPAELMAGAAKRPMG